MALSGVLAKRQARTDNAITLTNQATLTVAVVRNYANERSKGEMDLHHSACSSELNSNLNSSSTDANFQEHMQQYNACVNRAAKQHEDNAAEIQENFKADIANIGTDLENTLNNPFYSNDYHDYFF